MHLKACFIEKFDSAGTNGFLFRFEVQNPVAGEKINVRVLIFYIIFNIRYHLFIFFLNIFNSYHLQQKL